MIVGLKVWQRPFSRPPLLGTCRWLLCLPLGAVVVVVDFFAAVVVLLVVLRVRQRLVVEKETLMLRGARQLTVGR